MTDRKVLYRITISSLAVLLLALILPNTVSGRILTAILLLPLAIITYVFIKKRSILSINKNQVLMLMLIIGLLYLMFYYLSGLHFGFYRSGYKPDLYYTLNFVLPITAIVIETEFIRWIVRAQNNKVADVLTYFSCVIAESLICSTFFDITSFVLFMDFFAMSLFPAITANLLYHYLSKRYGMLPNIVFRLPIALYTYIIPYKVAVPDSLLAFINLLFPIAVLLFIDMLFEKKKRYALGKKSKLSTLLTIVALAIMVSVVMLISNQFRYGVLVVATESMTGELNKGDAALFERYDDQIIAEGQVIVFEKNKSMIIHRVIKIEKINGVIRYYTQGDANDSRDSGFITNSNIVGLVDYKIPYVGYPTIWVRSLFKR